MSGLLHDILGTTVEPSGAFARLSNHGAVELPYRAIVSAVVGLCTSKGLFTQDEYQAALDEAAANILTNEGGS
jgi:hypothetical protein